MLPSFSRPACARRHWIPLAVLTIALAGQSAWAEGSAVPESAPVAGPPSAAEPSVAETVPAPGPESVPPIQTGRLDAHLARLAATAENRGPLVFAPAALPADRTISLYARAVPGRKDALISEIQSLGGRSQAVSKRILSVRLPVRALPALGRSANLDRAEAALPRRPLLDVSTPEIGADRVVSGAGLAQPLTGEGVILGLVDTGLDYRHPAFRNPDGLPRVLALWDQTADGEPPPGQTVGRLCAYETLVDGSCPALDLIGHGTHVAATAGGSDPSFTGVAPKVEFLSAGSLTFELLAESARWIFDEAEALGRPAVINMSLGGHYGAHDGSSLEEQALTEMSGPGRIVVVAAGNDGGRRIHLSYPLEETPGRTALYLYSGFLGDGGFIDLWNAPGGEMRVQVAVLDGDGEIAAATGFRGPDDAVFSGPLETGDGTSLGQVQILFEPAHPETGKERANVFVVPGQDPNTFAGNAGGWQWVLELEGQGTFHGWIASAAFGSAPAEFGVGNRGGNDRSVVAMPGTAPGVITVAAYTTRNAWEDIDGNWFEDPGPTVGDIAFFSSPGPAVDPARTGLKPELAAPGEFIAAPFGQNALIFDRSTLLYEDVAAMRGTSMAAPHVAGVVALLLEARPTLDRDEALEILRTTARIDAQTGEVPNDHWGWGKLDAHAAALAVVGPPVEMPEEAGGCGCETGDGAWGGLWPALLLLGIAAGFHRRPINRRR